MSAVDETALKVAVLQQIAADTKETLNRLERQMENLRTELKADFRWLLGLMVWLLGMLIAGFAALAGIIGHALHLF